MAKIPCCIQQEILQFEQRPLNTFMTFNVGIRSGLSNTSWKCDSHPLVEQYNFGMQVGLIINGQVPNRDLHIGYYAWAPAIVGFWMQAENQSSKGYSFVAFVSPPAAVEGPAFGRNIVFMVDRSGSMTGQPLDLAKDAVALALDTLNSNDCFSIIAYDHSKC